MRLHRRLPQSKYISVSDLLTFLTVKSNLGKGYSGHSMFSLSFDLFLADFSECRQMCVLKKVCKALYNRYCQKHYSVKIYVNAK